MTNNSQVKFNTVINCANGIRLLSSYYNSIRENYIFQNDNIGINLMESSNNSFKLNTVDDNKVGVYLDAKSANNKFTLNNFFNNGEVQNIDLGTNNIFTENLWEEPTTSTTGNNISSTTTITNETNEQASPILITSSILSLLFLKYRKRK